MTKGRKGEIILGFLFLEVALLMALGALYMVGVLTKFLWALYLVVHAIFVALVGWTMLVDDERLG